jgi:hypothetical protein
MNHLNAPVRANFFNCTASSSSFTLRFRQLLQSISYSMFACVACALLIAQSAYAGARGEYFNGTSLSGAPIERYDQNVDFDWKLGAPIQGLSADNFSVRWTSQLTPQSTAPYTVCAAGDDGVRLWVNGELLVDDWIDSAAKERCGTIKLTAAQTYSLKLEYFERTGQASIKLLWSSPNMAKQVVPATALSCCSDRGGIAGRMSKGRELDPNASLGIGSREINYNWGNRAAKDEFGADNFTVRWSGIASPKTSGRYTFYVTADDGVRLRVNGVTLVDKWFEQAASTYSGTAETVSSGGFQIELDYFENAGQASVKLEWEGPNQPREVIPMGAFFATFGLGTPLNSSLLQNASTTPPPATTGRVLFVANNGNDSNAGTQAAPFATIQKAVDAAQPGETVRVAAGNYNVTQPINVFNKKATKEKPITLEGTNKPVLRWNGGVMNGFDGVITVRDSSHIIVRGFRVENSGLFGILAQETDSVTIENNVVDTSIASGIAYFTGSNAIVRGNDLSRFCNNGQNGTKYNCQEGLSIADVVGFDVDGNIVHDALQSGAPGGKPANPGGGEGIDVKGASRNGTVRNNTVYNLNQLGIYIDGYSKKVENVQVFNNIVHNTSAGIVIAAETETGGVSNVDVLNNLVFNNGLDGISISGTYVGNNPSGQPGLRDGIRIFHNTSVGNGFNANKSSWDKSNNYGSGINVDSSNVRAILIANNVVANNSTTQVTAKSTVDRTRLTIDRNLSFPSGRGGEILGNNAITSDPKFVDVLNKNFRLSQQSPAISAASNASPKPKTDLAGELRDTSGPSDLGAYEY